MTTDRTVAPAGADAAAQASRSGNPVAPGWPHRLYSFDVFDTLVTRVTWKPEDLFLLLGLRLHAAGLLGGTAAPVEEFAPARIASEAGLRRRPGVEEVDLLDIYRAMAPALGWSEREAAFAAALEVGTEEAAIRPIAPAARGWRSCARQAPRWRC